MINSKIEEFKTWLEKEENRNWKMGLAWTQELKNIQAAGNFTCLVEGKDSSQRGFNFATNRTWQPYSLVAQKWNLETQIQTNQARIQELENEVSTHLRALDTAQEWHERQKRELTEQRDQVIQEKQQLHNQLQDQKQRILALEADKSDLIHQLAQAKEIYQNHLNQEKSQLTKEIKLIKEVLHG